MGTLHEAYWASTGYGSSRRQRQSGTYRWFLPSRIADSNPTLSFSTVALVTAASERISQAPEDHRVYTDGITRMLLRSEAVGSSHIEGLVISSKRLLRAELHDLEPDNVRYDASAAAVLGNIHAMEKARELAQETATFDVDVLKRVHAELCRGTEIEPYGGVVRTTQNWVGGSSYNPLSAEYVPPAPEDVEGLLEDLAVYINRDDVPAIIQAAVAHAQFESIHPFADGNGRCGRALIQIVLQRRGIPVSSIPPISLALATAKGDYLQALGAFQHCLSPEEEAAALDGWVSVFCECALLACDDMDDIRRDLRTIRTRWEERLGGVRRGSAVNLMLDEMQAMPYFTCETMEKAIGRSKQAVALAVTKLLECGVIAQTNKGKRRRVFECPDILEEFNLVERRLASPARDTSSCRPNRPVPARG